EGEWGAPFCLVGQAPGPMERVSRRPFSGRAGKELDRWMLRAGFRDPEEFRRLTYIAALMRCFPGRNRQNTGDLRPPPAAVANCAHWLDAELQLLRPKVLILVGQMAIARFLDPGNPCSGSVNKIKPDGTVAKGAVGQRASGYSIVEAPSLDKATKMAKGCPVIKGGAQVAVYETFNVM